MEFFVQYIIDDVGYAKTVSATNADDAKATCEEEMKDAYPLSACAVTSVEKVEKVKKSKEKDVKEEE